MFKRTAFLIVLVMCAFAGTARAQFFIEEGKVSLAVSSGERISRTITVHNTSDETLTVRVYWEDFQYQPPYDGTKLFLAAGTAPGSASQWITYAPAEFAMAPFSQQKVEYVIDVPQGIEGGHYGVLFIERAPAPLEADKGVKIVTRVGCLFFIEAKSREKTAVIEDLKVNGRSFSGTFVNKGNVVLVPQMTYYIMNADGLVMDRGEVRKMYVPPGAGASWDIPLPEESAGRFTLFLNADLEEGDIVVKEVDLVKDPAGTITIEKMRD